MHIIYIYIIYVYTRKGSTRVLSKACLTLINSLGIRAYCQEIHYKNKIKIKKAGKRKREKRDSGILENVIKHRYTDVTSYSVQLVGTSNAFYLQTVIRRNTTSERNNVHFISKFDRRSTGFIAPSVILFYSKRYFLYV